MRLESSILIDRTPLEVWGFLGDPANVPKWDRGVAAVEPSSSPQPDSHVAFDTVAGPDRKLSDQGRMSYRIKSVDRENGTCVVALTSSTGNARFFRNAEWHFRVKPEGSGSRVICIAVFEVRPRYFLIGILLYFKTSAIQLDLTLLKQAIEAAPR